jgi:hypothetical protein
MGSVGLFLFHLSVRSNLALLNCVRPLVRGFRIRYGALFVELLLSIVGNFHVEYALLENAYSDHQCSYRYWITGGAERVALLDCCWAQVT